MRNVGKSFELIYFGDKFVQVKNYIFVSFDINHVILISHKSKFTTVFSI